MDGNLRTGGHILIEQLALHNADTVFGVPGESYLAALDGDFTPLMSLANARKDVRYYARWLEDAGLPGFMADAVHQTYRQAALLGHDGESCTAVIKAYEAVTGVEARVRPHDRNQSS